MAGMDRNRIVKPQESFYKPPPGGARHEAEAESWEVRRDAWINHYENGEGFQEAVKEAWAMFMASRKTKSAIQEAAQAVGWPTGRLLEAFENAGYKIRKDFDAWRKDHIRKWRSEQ